MERALGGFSTSELEQANYKTSYKWTNISTPAFGLHDFFSLLSIGNTFENAYHSINLQYVK